MGTHNPKYQSTYNLLRGPKGSDIVEVISTLNPQVGSRLQGLGSKLFSGSSP